MTIFGIDATLCWFILGIIFLVVEVATPGFLCIFFGLGAFAAAVTALFTTNLTAQGLVFIFVSVASLLTLRRKLAALFKGRMAENDNLPDSVFTSRYIGREVEVIRDITPGQPGMVELNGTNWQAKVEGDTVLKEGRRVKVTALNGLTLTVAPID